MAIRYSKITMNVACGGTIYSTGKGHTIIRRGDTVIVTHEAYSRVVHIPWVAIAEADYVEHVPDMPDVHPLGKPYSNA